MASQSACREILWGALTCDETRIQAALDASDGIVAEALQVVCYVEVLREVRDAAMQLATAELQRRNSLRDRLRNADWLPLMSALSSAHLD